MTPLTDSSLRLAPFFDGDADEALVATHGLGTRLEILSRFS